MQPINAIGYARVSTQEQAEGGHSLSTQDEAIRKYADLYKIGIVEIIHDEGFSAKSLDRPGIKRAFAMLDAGQANALIINRFDRLTRSIVDWGGLIVDYFTKDVQLHSVTDKIDTASASGRLVLNMMVAISQWEREIISERVREIVGSLREQGILCNGTPRLGWTHANGFVEKHPEEQKVLKRLRELREAGLPYRSIAKLMQGTSVPSRPGLVWSKSFVEETLKRMNNGPRTHTEYLEGLAANGASEDELECIRMDIQRRQQARQYRKIMKFRAISRLERQMRKNDP